MNGISISNGAILPQPEWCFGTEAFGLTAKVSDSAIRPVIRADNFAADNFADNFVAAATDRTAPEEQLRLKRLTAFGRSFSEQSLG